MDVWKNKKICKILFAKINLNLIFQKKSKIVKILTNRIAEKFSKIKDKSKKNKEMIIKFNFKVFKSKTLKICFKKNSKNKYILNKNKMKIIKNKIARIKI